MKHFCIKTMAVLALLLLCIPMDAQMVYVKNGKPQGRILLPSENKTDRRAAQLLQDFTHRISGTTVTIVASSAKPHKGDVVIRTDLNQPGITEDGFALRTVDGVLHIVGGEGKGSIYGVVTLLEKYLGCSYWSENEYTIPSLKTIEFPSIQHAENPTFRYRQSQNYAMQNDSIYKLWYRLEEPGEEFAANYWVHTFNRLLPAAEYGKEHPEYYAYFKGKRHPGKASQWCLSNPEVFEIVANRIDSIFKANPDKKMIAVSQNDGQFTHCTCDKCRAIDEYEGALSGSVIHFLNKLAKRFPDKRFATLAYLYTMNPPKHVKPLPNVCIMLCDIDCKREVSLTENPSGQYFTKALRGWSAITDNIYVWDYGINFDGYLTPFMNFHILQDNIRLFKENNVTMHFSQIASNRGGDFAELRTYMVSKLMWNADADADSLMHHFLNGYYKEAGPYIYRYIKMAEGALLGSGKPLWIYDSPVTHKHGMLKPELMRRYKSLFDQAEAAVADDQTVLRRVQRTRLPLQYSELEIARTEDKKDFNDIVRQLDLFEKRVAELKVPTLNERSNSPLDYVKLYRERYLPRDKKNIAAGATVTFYPDPVPRYKQLGETALTDGLFGGTTFQDSWVGWEGIDASFVLDMHEEKSFQSIESDFLHQLGSWVLLPKQVKYSISNDGKNFTEVGTYDLPEDHSVQVKFKSVKHTSASPLKARYIKVEVVGTKDCPHWHYGVGNPCWFFLDEVTVE